MEDGFEGEDFEEKQEDEDIEECCLCGESLMGFGNNAQPLKEGKCCDSCNIQVIKERLKSAGFKKCQKE